MKFHIITFGCQMNVCDSYWLKHALKSKGWDETSESEADIILVNTCSVREKPEKKVYSLLGRLRELSKNKPFFLVGVGGCVAQQIGERFWERYPYVRLVFGPDGVVSVPSALQKLVENPGLRISLLDFEDYYPEREQVWQSAQLHPQAFVNIMQGCDNFCAYCIVPYTRGRQKSRSSQAILQECEYLVANGVREITLLGQNVNSYGRDNSGDGVSFAQLLHKVCSLNGLERLRFTTSHPKDIASEVIEAYGKLSNLCPSLHLPLQSGSNKILKQMGRKYTREDYFRIIEKLRKIREGVTISTDLMVGFPGETYEDFLQTLDLVQKIGFDSSYSFKYSDRPGVRSSAFTGKIPEEIKAVRLYELQDLQEELTQHSLKRLVGKELEVLVEGYSARNNEEYSFWRGREPGGRVVNFRYPELLDLFGKMVRVKIKQAKKHSIFGEAVSLPW